MDAIKFRLAKGKNYLQVLKNIFSEAQILCTGYSDIISGKIEKEMKMLVIVNFIYVFIGLYY